MSLDRRSLFNILLLVLMLFSTWMFLKKSAHQPESLPASPDKPNFFINNMKATEFNKQGSIANILEAQKITHFDKHSRYADDTARTLNKCYNNPHPPLSGDLANIETPRIQIFRDSKKPTFITANTAQAINQNTAITFQGNVVIQQPALKSKGPAETITTTELIACPDKNFAYTTKPIELHGSTDVHSTGASVNIKTGEINFTSRATATYDPN